METDVRKLTKVSGLGKRRTPRPCAGVTNKKMSCREPATSIVTTKIEVEYTRTRNGHSTSLGSVAFSAATCRHHVEQVKKATEVALREQIERSATVKIA